MEINGCCKTYVETGQVDSNIDLVKSKLKIVSCCEEETNLHGVVCNGAAELFHRMSHSYFGTAIYSMYMSVKS